MHIILNQYLNVFLGVVLYGRMLDVFLFCYAGDVLWNFLQNRSILLPCEQFSTENQHVCLYYYHHHIGTLFPTKSTPNKRFCIWTRLWNWMSQKLCTLNCVAVSYRLGLFFLLFHDSLTSANPFYLVDVFDSRLNVVFRFANMKRLPNQPKYRERWEGAGGGRRGERISFGVNWGQNCSFSQITIINAVGKCIPWWW